MSAALDRNLRILETYDEIEEVERLFPSIWPGSDVDTVPAHLLVTLAKNGGLVIGAYQDEQLVGFVFGFLGFTTRPDLPKIKHCSHQLGVHPDFENRGLGFKLKRAQWQMVRNQGIELVTWTFDALVSRNALLNIAKLGAVSSLYKRDVYGQMRDDLNAGLPSDRLQIDWWVNSARVDQRLSSRPRRRLDLAHFIEGGALNYNRTRLNDAGLPIPLDELLQLPENSDDAHALLLVEIPSDFMAVKAADMDLALQWRLHTRPIFEKLFSRGYLITDFVFLPGKFPRSDYVLSRGDNTLGK
ncbi:MAG: GNAT family N-acetyltransferase [Chloroflexi bacterium]|nr:GNAT family N-acetyltransferase [Chloroflexota bacterium]